MHNKMLNKKGSIKKKHNHKIELATALRINLRRRKEIKKKNTITQDDKKL